MQNIFFAQSKIAATISIKNISLTTGLILIFLLTFTFFSTGFLKPKSSGDASISLSIIGSTEGLVSTFGSSFY